jgi:2'-5' RNA ligase
MRLFVALRPPPAAIGHLAAALPRWPSVPDRWHLTLAFLGEVEDPAPVAAGLRRVAAAAAPFPLALRGSGTFGRGAVVWVGLAGDVPALRSLAGEVTRACRAAGAAVDERPYRPHLTVGRKGHPDPAALASYDGPSWPATEVELVRSDVGRTVRHTVLERFALSG